MRFEICGCGLMPKNKLFMHCKYIFICRFEDSIIYDLTMKGYCLTMVVLFFCINKGRQTKMMLDGGSFGCLLQTKRVKGFLTF